MMFKYVVDTIQNENDRIYDTKCFEKMNKLN